MGFFSHYTFLDVYVTVTQFGPSSVAPSMALVCPWDGLIHTQWVGVGGGLVVLVVVVGGGVTRKRLVAKLLYVSSAKAHITLISSPFFTHKTHPQLFRDPSSLKGQKSSKITASSCFSLFFLFHFFSKSPSFLHQGHLQAHT